MHDNGFQHPAAVIDMQSDDGSRVEVRRLGSGHFSLMFFPARGRECHVSDCNYVTLDHATLVASIWIAASVRPRP